MHPKSEKDDVPGAGQDSDGIDGMPDDQKQEADPSFHMFCHKCTTASFAVFTDDASYFLGDSRRLSHNVLASKNCGAASPEQQAAVDPERMLMLQYVARRLPTDQLRHEGLNFPDQRLGSMPSC
jgi:hypothetical protein